MDLLDDAGNLIATAHGKVVRCKCVFRDGAGTTNVKKTSRDEIEVEIFEGSLFDAIGKLIGSYGGSGAGNVTDLFLKIDVAFGTTIWNKCYTNRHGGKMDVEIPIDYNP